jgi:catechol 2,3-dioxygenase-like lactoylglutathione lyase family enzyme
VADLEASVAFSAKLFGAEPAKRRPGYANFAIAEPPLRLVLLEGEPGQPTVMDHLGIEVETTEQLGAATSRLTESGLITLSEDDTEAAMRCRTRCGSTVRATSRGRSMWSRGTRRSATSPGPMPPRSAVDRATA